MTVEELIRTAFGGAAFERCAYEFECYDEQGCVGHVGMEERKIVVRYDEDEDEELRVAAIRYVVTRADCQGRGFAARLMGAAHHTARRCGLRYAVLFTDVREFYVKLGYQQSDAYNYRVRDLPSRAMVLALPSAGSYWPERSIRGWQTVGPEW